MDQNKNAQGNQKSDKLSQQNPGNRTSESGGAEQYGGNRGKQDRGAGRQGEKNSGRDDQGDFNDNMDSDYDDLDSDLPSRRSER